MRTLDRITPALLSMSTLGLHIYGAVSAQLPTSWQVNILATVARGISESKFNRFPLPPSERSILYHSDLLMLLLPQVGAAPSRPSSDDTEAIESNYWLRSNKLSSSCRHKYLGKPAHSSLCPPAHASSSLSYLYGPHLGRKEWLRERREAPGSTFR